METQFDVAKEIINILKQYQLNKIDKKDVAIIISGLIESYAEDKIQKRLIELKAGATQPEAKFQVSMVKCDLCGYEWTAVRPLGTEKLQCSQCNHVTNFENV